MTVTVAGWNVKLYYTGTYSLALRDKWDLKPHCRYSPLQTVEPPDKLPRDYRLTLLYLKHYVSVIADEIVFTMLMDCLLVSTAFVLMLK